MQSEIFQAFICYDFDDYGLQLMKIQNSKSQKIWILHEIKRISDTEMSALWKL